MSSKWQTLDQDDAVKGRKEEEDKEDLTVEVLLAEGEVLEEVNIKFVIIFKLKGYKEACFKIYLGWSCVWKWNLDERRKNLHLS